MVGLGFYAQLHLMQLGFFSDLGFGGCSTRPLSAMCRLAGTKPSKMKLIGASLTNWLGWCLGLGIWFWLVLHQHTMLMITYGIGLNVWSLVYGVTWQINKRQKPVTNDPYPQIPIGVDRYKKMILTIGFSLVVLIVQGVVWYLALYGQNQAHANGLGLVLHGHKTGLQITNIWSLQALNSPVSNLDFAQINSQFQSIGLGGVLFFLGIVFGGLHWCLGIGWWLWLMATKTYYPLISGLLLQPNNGFVIGWLLSLVLGVSLGKIVAYYVRNYLVVNLRIDLALVDCILVGFSLVSNILLIAWFQTVWVWVWWQIVVGVVLSLHFLGCCYFVIPKLQQRYGWWANLLPPLKQTP